MIMNKKMPQLSAKRDFFGMKIFCIFMHRDNLQGVELSATATYLVNLQFNTLQPFHDFCLLCLTIFFIYRFLIPFSVSSFLFPL